MEMDDLICTNIFCAVQYIDHVNTVIDEMKNVAGLKDFIKFIPHVPEAMQEFRAMNLQMTDNKGVLMFKPLEDPDIIDNVIKFGPNRIELNHNITEINNEDIFYGRCEAVFKIHDNLYTNRATKFGLVKTFSINNDNKKYSSLLPLKEFFQDDIHSSKTHVLLKKDDFNINFTINIVNNSYFFIIDINDIIELNKVFDWDHFAIVKKKHTEIFEQVISIIGNK